MSDLLASLNNNATGVGLYGAFGLDTNGVLSFTPNAAADAKVSVVTDNTQRGAAGPRSASSSAWAFRSAPRAPGASRSRRSSTPTRPRCPWASWTPSAAVGAIAVRPGDGQGALAIAQAGDINTLVPGRRLAGPGDHDGVALAAGIRRLHRSRAAAAETRKASAESVSVEATNRRQSVEGVNLDEELVNLTTYQQAFNASARMIQAVGDLYDVLLGIV